jgi:hypothetical protein
MLTQAELSNFQENFMIKSGKCLVETARSLDCCIQLTSFITPPAILVSLVSHAGAAKSTRPRARLMTLQLSAEHSPHLQLQVDLKISVAQWASSAHTHRRTSESLDDVCRDLEADSVQEWRKGSKHQGVLMSRKINKKRLGAGEA